MSNVKSDKSSSARDTMICSLRWSPRRGQTTPPSPAAFARLLRWTLINQGFAGIGEAMAVEARPRLSDEEPIHVTVSSAQVSASLLFDARFELCIATFYRSTWDQEDFESVQRVIGWLEREHNASQPSLVHLPAGLRAEMGIGSDEEALQAVSVQLVAQAAIQKAAVPGEAPWRDGRLVPPDGQAPLAQAA